MPTVHFYNLDATKIVRTRSYATRAAAANDGWKNRSSLPTGDGAVRYGGVNPRYPGITRIWYVRIRGPNAVWYLVDETGRDYDTLAEARRAARRAV
jgi:hypothetical protein